MSYKNRSHTTMKMLDKQRENRFLAFTANQRPSNSFYSHIQNAAITLKLHGLFPFENLHSDDGRSLSFKWFGWDTVWGFSLYTGSSIVLGLLSFNRSGSRIQIYMYVAQSSLYYCFHLCNYRTFSQLLRAMEYINDKFVELDESIRPRRVSTIKFWIIFEVVTVTLLGFHATITLLSNSKPPPAYQFALTVVMTIVNSYLEFYISIMYLMVTSLILVYYERLNRRLNKVLQNQQTKRTLLDELENLRILHTDLVDACNLLEEWFSLTMISLVFSVILQTLLKAVLIFFITRKISLTNDFLLLLFKYLYIFILTTTTHKLVKSSFQICNIVKNTSSLRFSSDIQFQCRLAVLQTTMVPINVRALGLFPTSRPLVPCILSLCATCPRVFYFP